MPFNLYSTPFMAQCFEAVVSESSADCDESFPPTCISALLREHHRNPRSIDHLLDYGAQDQGLGTCRQEAGGERLCLITSRGTDQSRQGEG
jgi:hypothetical protein